MSPYLAEYFGTLLLVLLGEGVIAGIVLKGSKNENAGTLALVVAWGLAVTLAVYAVGNISGAHLNPAITLALAVKGDFNWILVPGYIVSQMAGGFTGAVVVWVHYLPHWKGTDDPSAKLSIFATSPAIKSTGSNLFSEVLATMVLVLGLLFIGANHFADGLNPLVIGSLIIAIGLSLGGTTGWAINPARDLGPRLAHFLLPIPGKGPSDWSYAWIPVVGPLIGGMLGVGLFEILFH